MTPQYLWGAGPRVKRTPNPQILVMYYKGLPRNTTCLRVDIVRHMEAIPRNNLREIITVARPTHSPDSLAVVANAGPHLPALHAQTPHEALRDRSGQLVQGGQSNQNVHQMKMLMNHAMLTSKRGDFVNGLKRVIAQVRANPALSSFFSSMGKTLIAGGAAALFGPEAAIPAEMAYDAIGSAVKQIK